MDYSRLWQLAMGTPDPEKPANLVVYISGHTDVDSALSTRDRDLVELLKRVLPEHGYRVKVTGDGAS